MGNRNAYCSFCRKSYQDVGPLVEGPGEVYICGECIELCQSIIDQEKRRRSRSAGRIAPMPTPEAIRGKLDQRVTGQDVAKGLLVLAALHRGGVSGQGPQNPVLLIGPAHSSKVFLARALAHALEAPFAEGDSQALVRSGSEPVAPLLFWLLAASDFDAEAAQRGVVYVDGIDQRATQDRLLQLWEGAESHTADRVPYIDVARLLFICGGAFAGLDQNVARLGRHPEQPVTGEILEAFGMAPELARRFRAIARVEPFDEETLVHLVPLVDLDRMIAGSANASTKADRPRN
jgi:ATP-dependent Clp protease ATP-binding subunit ClpX